MVTRSIVKRDRSQRQSGRRLNQPAKRANRLYYFLHGRFLRLVVFLNRELKDRQVSFNGVKEIADKRFHASPVLERFELIFCCLLLHLKQFLYTMLT